MSPEPTTPTREEVEASANAALDECAALTDGDIKVMARWIKQRLTSEPAGPDEHGQTPEAYEELGRSFFEEYNRVQNDPAMEGYICADSPVEIIPHLLNAVGDLKAELALSVETSRQLQSAIDVDTKALVALVEERREPEPAASMMVAKICAANRTADPPQDCDWPFCGCDPAATKVIEVLSEMDLLKQRLTIAPTLRCVECKREYAESDAQWDETFTRWLCPVCHVVCVKMDAATKAPSAVDRAQAQVRELTAAINDARPFLAALEVFCQDDKGQLVFGKTAGKIGSDARAMLARLTEATILYPDANAAIPVVDAAQLREKATDG